MIELIFLASSFVPYSKMEEYYQLYTSEQVCIAQNMYWEIRKIDEVSEKAMYAVSLAVKNRVENKSGRWPDSYCDAIKHSKYPGMMYKCQFSWYCDGRPDRPLLNEVKNFERSLELAYLFKRQGFCTINDGCGKDFTNGAVLYHAHTVSPDWDYSKIEISYVDPYHIFYKYKQ